MTGNSDAETLSGIERAIEMHGNQTLFAEQLSAHIGEKVAQSRISTWLSYGYVPAGRAQAVSDITGIPLADLIRKTRRTRRMRGRNDASA